jgi:hypothetical protein
LIREEKMRTGGSVFGFVLLFFMGICMLAGISMLLASVLAPAGIDAAAIGGGLLGLAAGAWGGCRLAAITMTTGIVGSIVFAAIFVATGGFGGFILAFFTGGFFAAVAGCIAWFAACTYE